MEPLVSVVVPVYNVEKYLRQCLDSVVAQTYGNLEILVVDDGSTDGSGAICDAYADGRIRVFHTENRGLSAARNYALDRARGAYIAFLDSDDWFEEDAIRTLMDTATATGADIVSCRFYWEYVNKTCESFGSQDPFTVHGAEILKAEIIERSLSNVVWNKVYKAELFSSVRYPVGRVYEDCATTYRLLQKADRLVYIPACLIHYRMRDKSISNSHSMKSLIDYWLAYKERFEALGPVSGEYYRVTLSAAIGAVSRMWRWYALCDPSEKRQGQAYLDEMQRFAKEHRDEVLSGAYSQHVKAVCRCAQIRNPVVFKLLYLANNMYRSKNKNKYFDK